MLPNKNDPVRPIVAVDELRGNVSLIPRGGRVEFAESVLANLKEVVFQTDEVGRWMFLNPAWEELTGYAVEATLGKSFLDYVFPEDRERNMDLFQPLIARQKEFCRHEIRYRRGEDDFCWVEVFARLTLDENDNVTGTAGTLCDITERKAAEEKLKLAASVFSNAGEGIMITSAQGIIIEVNSAFEEITGYSRNDVVGKNPNILTSGRQSKEFYASMWGSLHTNGRWQGEVWNRRKTGELYVERLTITTIMGPDGFLVNYVGLFSDITTQKLHSEDIERIAHYDPLTGLPNRRLLADRLQQSMSRARRNSSSVAVAYIDLDGFKAVNDRHGHDYGDELLITVSSRILNAVRESDTTARLGGDEFVVVFDCVKGIEECRPMLVRLLDAIAQPIIVRGTILGVSGSIGISLYSQDEEIDADQLLRQADQAMYQAKLQGKNQYVEFDCKSYQSTVNRNESIDLLRRALANNEFALHYQPIVDLRSGALHAVEALIRWCHPQRGCLSPGEFLPLIEGHPFMILLENWVLEEALCQHERWIDAGWDIAISINMSSAQLHQNDLVDQLKRKLSAHPRVLPRRIKLEVLETSALNDLNRVSRLITECEELGISFALDDFGTGYSSLLYLKQLPAKRIKIDQGFVRDMLEDSDDLAILEGVIGMAFAFEREVIAEGVETIKHAEILLRLGCYLVQGFGISHPLPADQLIRWLGDWALPPQLRDCPPLKRGDILLLKALVENTAWFKSVRAYVTDSSKTKPTRNVGGRRRINQWMQSQPQIDGNTDGMVRTVETTIVELEQQMDKFLSDLPQQTMFSELTEKHKQFICALDTAMRQ